MTNRPWLPIWLDIKMYKEINKAKQNCPWCFCPLELSPVAPFGNLEAILSMVLDLPTYAHSSSP